VGACACGGVVMCGCSDNCVGVLVVCVLVFTVLYCIYYIFCIVSLMYIYSHLFLSVLV